jgi:Zeta toxin
MSGGNGAGKSTSVDPAGAEHIVVDSTLSEFELSRANIERALAAGFGVEIRHLSRDVEESWRAVLDRAMHEGDPRQNSSALIFAPLPATIVACRSFSS